MNPSQEKQTQKHTDGAEDKQASITYPRTGPGSIQPIQYWTFKARQGCCARRRQVCQPEIFACFLLWGQGICKRPIGCEEESNPAAQDTAKDHQSTHIGG